MEENVFKTVDLRNQLQITFLWRQEELNICSLEVVMWRTSKVAKIFSNDIPNQDDDTQVVAQKLSELYDAIHSNVLSTDNIIDLLLREMDELDTPF